MRRKEPLLLVFQRPWNRHFRLCNNSRWSWCLSSNNSRHRSWHNSLETIIVIIMQSYLLQECFHSWFLLHCLQEPHVNLWTRRRIPREANIDTLVHVDHHHRRRRRLNHLQTWLLPPPPLLPRESLPTLLPLEERSLLDLEPPIVSQDHHPLLQGSLVDLPQVILTLPTPLLHQRISPLHLLRRRRNRIFRPSSPWVKHLDQILMNPFITFIPQTLLLLPHLEYSMQSFLLQTHRLLLFQVMLLNQPIPSHFLKDIQRRPSKIPCQDHPSSSTAWQLQVRTTSSSSERMARRTRPTDTDVDTAAKSLALILPFRYTFDPILARDLSSVMSVEIDFPRKETSRSTSKDIGRSILMSRWTRILSQNTWTSFTLHWNPHQDRSHLHDQIPLLLLQGYLMGL